WTGNGWQGIDGGAERIAVDNQGLPWVVNNAGKIFRREGNLWIGLPGSARDIGVGANGTAWVIGTDPTPGGHGIHYWTGNGWQGIDGGAERIAVDNQGLPWVVNNAGKIFRREV
ncbi:tectonin domain-containing protein, partial [Pseudarthrobacter siccitolerans]|uniref:tectonin domain-containing protein n=1 Tax=Pseudarthrobacter siccitolerans TaxID=861266 RepID=UPI000AEC08E6